MLRRFRFWRSSFSLRTEGLVTLAILAWVGRASGQELELKSPLASACPAAIVREATPAVLEWTYWVSAGAARTSDASWGASAGIGAELTAQLASTVGFPACARHGKRRNRGELRAGVWSAASARTAVGAVEGGALLKLGDEYHAVFGTFDLRLGAGYASFGETPSAHGVATLTYGVYSVPARYSKRGYCDPSPSPRSTAMASVARLFATHRRALGGVDAWELVFGVELSPTFALPPYGWGRWSGGWPW